MDLPRTDSLLPLAAEAGQSGPRSHAAHDGGGGEFLDLLLRSGASPSFDERDSDAEQSALAPGARPAEAVLELPIGRGRATETGTALRSIARYLWQMAHRGESRMELQLLPRELGRLTLCIELRGDEVHVQAHAGDARVLQLLVEGKEELAAGLARWGLRLGSFWAGSSEGAIVERGSASRAAAEEQTTHDPQPEPADHSGCSFFEVVI